MVTFVTIVPGLNMVKFVTIGDSHISRKYCLIPNNSFLENMVKLITIVPLECFLVSAVVK